MKVCEPHQGSYLYFTVGWLLPTVLGEKARITAAGGFVEFGRVNGNLALSRAIGDFEFKKSAELAPEQQIVTSFPDVTVHERSDDDEFMILACDGRSPPIPSSSSRHGGRGPSPRGRPRGTDQTIIDR